MDKFHESIEIEQDQSFQMFPPKPIIDNSDQPDSIQKSLGSLLLFMLTFYIFFQDMYLVVMIAFVLIIHEMGHYVFMQKYGYKRLKMRFVPLLGAYVSGDKEKLSQKEQANILLAGPVPGIALGLLLLYLNGEFISDQIGLLARTLIIINIFNLLPLDPLDGGKLMKNFFIQSSQKLQAVFSVISILILIAVFLYLGSYFLLIIPFFMFRQLSAERKNNNLRKELNEIGISLKRNYEDLSDRDFWVIRERLIRRSPEFSDIPADKYIISPKESIILSRLQTLLVKVPEEDLSFLMKLMYCILWISFLLGPILFIIILYT